jgi:hypothetical protein
VAGLLWNQWPTFAWNQWPEWRGIRILENPEEIQQYMYGFMAADLNVTINEVQQVMFGVDAGHDRVTVRKRHC